MVKFLRQLLMPLNGERVLEWEDVKAVSVAHVLSNF